MKTKRLLLFLLCFVMLLTAVAVVVSASASEGGNGGSKAASGMADYANYEFPADKKASSYPIAVFEEHSDGTYTFKDLYAGSNWNTAINYAKTLAKSVVYLRADVTPGKVNDVFLNGRTAITVDLDGHTINKANIPYLMHVLAEEMEIDVEVTFKNGTLLNTCKKSSETDDKAWRAFFQFAGDEGHIYQDAYADFTFENVKFCDERTDDVLQKADGLIYSMGGSGSTKNNFVNVTLNNCELYPQQKVKAVFYSLDKNGTHVSLAMNGGKIVFPSAEAADKLISLDVDGDSVVFGKYNESYTEFVFPSNSTPTKSIVIKNDSDAELMLSNPTADGENIVYTPADFTDADGIADAMEKTPYATITGLTPEQTAEAYPLAVFKKQGNWYTLVGVYNDWYTGAEAAKFDGALIFFRESAICAVPEDPEESLGVGLCGCTARITVDLNGKSITATQKYLYDLVFSSTFTNVSVNFKNGEMIKSNVDANGKVVPEDARWRSFIFYNYNERHSTVGSRVDFTFDNVTFKNERSAPGTRTPYLMVLTHKNANVADTDLPEIKGGIIYNDCTFYPNGVSLFNAYENTNFMNLDITVNGGNIISDANISMAKLINIDSGYDTVTFGKYNGKYTEFIYPNDVTISNDIEVTDDGGLSRMLAVKYNGVGDTHTIYELAEKTPYGLLAGLTDEQKVATDYPLALFGSDGNLMAVYNGSQWFKAVNDAVDLPEAFIYLRADATPSNDPVYINDHTTKLLVDLNGKTLTRKNDAYFLIVLPTGADGNPKTDLDVTFKNGTLVNDCQSGDKIWRGFFQLTADKRHTTEDAYEDFTFDNVKFIDQRTASSGLHFIFSMAGADATKISTSTVVFNNCEMFPSAGVSNVFDFKDDVNINVAVTMNGGKIVSRNALTTVESLFKHNPGKDSLTFDRYDGKYTTVELPAGKRMDGATVWLTPEGIECVFVPSGNVYTLCPTILVGYKITTNVVLHTNFIYNIYVPLANVTAITFNGQAVSLDEITTVNNVDYRYLIKNIPVAESLEGMTLVVTLTTKGVDFDLTYNLGVFEYAENILSGEYIEMSKTLVKDMLFYSYQAHKYFGEYGDSVAAKLIEIEDILRSYYRKTPTGIARNPQSGYFLNMELSLDEKPGFRFYLVNPEAAGDFAFTVNGVAVESSNVITDTNEGGTYIEVIVPAYNMLSGIEITYQGASIGSYNLYSYYDYVIDYVRSSRPTMTPNELAENAKLVSIVEALMKYSKSASDYTNHVGNGGYGSMSLVVPPKIYPHVPGFDVTALFSNGTYYGNVTWTTSHANVYVENGKIYAIGEFANDTPVTVTASTEHHTASVNVTVVATNSQTYKYVANSSSGASGGDINNTGLYVKENGKNITGEYVVRGKFNIYALNQSTDTPHLQMRFVKTETTNDTIVRFYMSPNAQGEFNFKGGETGRKFTLNNGVLSLDFAVVVVGTTAYLYIEGILEDTLDVSQAEYLNLGALHMDVLFYDIELYTKANNEAKYNSAVAEYIK